MSDKQNIPGRRLAGWQLADQLRPAGVAPPGTATVASALCRDSGGSGAEAEEDEESPLELD